MIDDATRDRAIEGVDELLSLFVEGWMSPGTSKNVVDAVLSWVQPELDKARDEDLRLSEKNTNQGLLMADLEQQVATLLSALSDAVDGLEETQADPYYSWPAGFPQNYIDRAYAVLDAHKPDTA